MSRYEVTMMVGIFLIVFGSVTCLGLLIEAASEVTVTETTTYSVVEP
nr:hypothetical protein [Rhodococcus qingshengii]